MRIAIEPIPQALTANERRVKELLDKGWHYMRIAAKLRISFESCRDVIYEIRKKEAIVLAKLSNQEKRDIFNSWKSGAKQIDLARQYGVSKSAICQIIQKLEKAEQEVFGESAPDKPMPHTGINPDFEQAVDDMVAQDAPLLEDEITETASAIAEPDKLPEFIWNALDDRICTINLKIEEREQRIGELREEIAVLAEEHDKITEWMEAHE